MTEWRIIWTAHCLRFLPHPGLVPGVTGEALVFGMGARAGGASVAARDTHVVSSPHH